MKDVVRIAIAAIALGIIAIVFTVFAVLALSAIATGEPDLTLEWAVIRGALAIVVISQMLSLVAIRRLLCERRSVLAS